MIEFVRALAIGLGFLVGLGLVVYGLFGVLVLIMR